jgi:hypothetical protein
MPAQKAGFRPVHFGSLLLSMPFCPLKMLHDRSSRYPD